jgi:hypothetical protein
MDTKLMVICLEVVVKEGIETVSAMFVMQVVASLFTETFLSLLFASKLLDHG